MCASCNLYLVSITIYVVLSKFICILFCLRHILNVSVGLVILIC